MPQSAGRHGRARPVRTIYKIASTMSRRSCLNGRPIHVGSGRVASTIAHLTPDVRRTGVKLNQARATRNQSVLLCSARLNPSTMATMGRGGGLMRAERDGTPVRLSARVTTAAGAFRARPNVRSGPHVPPDFSADAGIPTMAYRR